MILDRSTSRNKSRTPTKTMSNEEHIMALAHIMIYIIPHAEETVQNASLNLTKPDVLPEIPLTLSECLWSYFVKATLFQNKA